MDGRQAVQGCLLLVTNWAPPLRSQASPRTPLLPCARRVRCDAALALAGLRDGEGGPAGLPSLLDFYRSHYFLAAEDGGERTTPACVAVSDPSEYFVAQAVVTAGARAGQGGSRRGVGDAYLATPALHLPFNPCTSPPHPPTHPPQCRCAARRTAPPRWTCCSSCPPSCKTTRPLPGVRRARHGWGASWRPDMHCLQRLQPAYNLPASCPIPPLQPSSPRPCSALLRLRPGGRHVRGPGQPALPWGEPRTPGRPGTAALLRCVGSLVFLCQLGYACPGGQPPSRVTSTPEPALPQHRRPSPVWRHPAGAAGEVPGAGRG